MAIARRQLTDPRPEFARRPAVKGSGLALQIGATGSLAQDAPGTISWNESAPGDDYLRPGTHTLYIQLPHWEGSGKVNFLAEAIIDGGTRFTGPGEH